jgi:hypothetical protein
MSDLFIECKKTTNSDYLSDLQNFVYDLENVYQENSIYMDDRKLYNTFEEYSFHTKVGILSGNSNATIQEYLKMIEYEKTEDHDNLMYFTSEEGNNWWKVKKIKCCEFVHLNLFIYDTLDIPSGIFNIDEACKLEGHDLHKYKVLFLHTKLCQQFFSIYSNKLFKRIIIVHPEKIACKSYFQKMKTNFLWLVTDYIDDLFKVQPYKKILPSQENFLQVIVYKSKND